MTIPVKNVASWYAAAMLIFFLGSCCGNPHPSAPAKHECSNSVVSTETELAKVRKSLVDLRSSDYNTWSIAVHDLLKMGSKVVPFIADDLTRDRGAPPLEIYLLDVLNDPRGLPALALIANSVNDPDYTAETWNAADDRQIVAIYAMQAYVHIKLNESRTWPGAGGEMEPPNYPGFSGTQSYFRRIIRMYRDLTKSKV